MGQDAGTGQEGGTGKAGLTDTGEATQDMGTVRAGILKTAAIHKNILRSSESYSRETKSSFGHN